MAAATGFERKHIVRWNLILTCFFMSFGSMTYGASNAVISTTLGQPSFLRELGLDQGGKYYSQSNSLIGATSSLYYAGGFFGPFIHGLLANSHGRKWSIFVACLTTLISQALITGSTHIGMFITFRFFAGWGAYHAVAAVPHYITELVPPRDRGKLTDIHAVGINVAYVITGWIGVGFFFLDSNSAWRGPLALTTIPPLVICLGIYWMPESPRYLMSKGRTEEAWKVLNRLHGDPSDPRNEFVKREFYQIRKQIEMDAELPSGYRDILSRPSYRKRAIITVTLLFCVMSSGILVIQNYGVIIFARLGYNELDRLLFQSGYTTNALLWSVVAMTFVDRVSRSKLLGVGYGMCGVFLTLLTILLSQYEDSTNTAGLGACVAMIFCYNVAFELGLDGPEFFYQAEIWPSHLRAKGYALATCIYSGINVVWLQAAPTAFATIGYYYYIIFIFFSFFGSAMAFFYFPDTLHKPLEEVAALFGDADLVAVYQERLGGGEESLEEIEAGIPHLGGTKTGLEGGREVASEKGGAMYVEKAPESDVSA